MTRRRISQVVDEKPSRRDGRRPPVPLIPCEGCGLELDAQKFTRFLKAISEGEDEAPAQLCDPCATYGPPTENPLNSLTGREVEGLQILASGGTFRAAARAMGTSVARLVQRIEGRSKERKVFRHAYKSLLLQSGVTPQLLTDKIREALDAEKITFTKDGGEYSQPDHGVRLKAVAMAERVLDLESRAQAVAAPVQAHNNFFFDTNLGNGEKTIDDAYEVFAKRVDDGDE